MPEVMAHPDGDIAFEWYVEPRRVLTIAVGPSEILHYAALFGKSSARGKEEFTGSMPVVLDGLLDRLYAWSREDQ